MSQSSFVDQSEREKETSDQMLFLSVKKPELNSSPNILNDYANANVSEDVNNNNNENNDENVESAIDVGEEKNGDETEIDGNAPSISNERKYKKANTNNFRNRISTKIRNKRIQAITVSNKCSLNQQMIKQKKL